MAASSELYVELAAVLAAEKALARHDFHTCQTSTYHAINAVNNLTRSIADKLAQDNPRFNRDIFYTAADLNG